MNQVDNVVLLKLVKLFRRDVILLWPEFFGWFWCHRLIHESDGILIIFVPFILVCSMRLYCRWLTVINQSFALGSLGSCHAFLVCMAPSLTELMTYGVLLFLYWLLLLVRDSRLVIVIPTRRIWDTMLVLPTDGSNKGRHARRWAWLTSSEVASACYAIEDFHFVSWRLLRNESFLGTGSTDILVLVLPIRNYVLVDLVRGGRF